MRTLGIDTSNYATSLAVFDTNAGEVVCDCKRFLPVREGQLGLRQSDALFHHTAALPEMLAELGQKVNLTQIEAVGVSARPRPVDGSYMPCFLAGVSAATAFCAAKGIPLVQTTHQQGHISAALFAASGADLFGKEELVFHVSGGTTDLLHCKGPDSITCIGTSSDLYAGQAVDRLGVRLGYAFPAGIYVSQLAAACTETNPKSACAAQPAAFPACRTSAKSCWQRAKARNMSVSTACSAWQKPCAAWPPLPWSGTPVCPWCLQAA